MVLGLWNRWMLRSRDVVLQSESTECGLACLAMIAARYDRRVTLRWLRVDTRFHFEVRRLHVSLRSPATLACSTACLPEPHLRFGGLMRPALFWLMTAISWSSSDVEPSSFLCSTRLSVSWFFPAQNWRSDSPVHYFGLLAVADSVKTCRWSQAPGRH